MPTPVSLELIDSQEARFAGCFRAGDISLARDLYHPDVVYLSPTTRLFGWPRRIEGVERTLEFIQLTIAGCRNIDYHVAERAVLADATSAIARIEFEWDAEGMRLRSNYVVLYRYRGDRIGQQELFYDPSDRPGTVPA